MKHTDLKPGDLLITRGYVGGTMRTVEVVKVTPKTMRVKNFGSASKHTQRFGGYGRCLYLPNPDVVDRLTEVYAEIKELNDRRRSILRELDMVTFTEVEGP